MNVLSFDTSTKAASVALVKDGVLLGEILINDKRTHSQKLMPMIENLFKLADISPKDIDLLAVCVGPGSFTGLRIAMATVKAMSHVKELDIVAVNSLESLAYNVMYTEKRILPIIDAQGKQIYSAEYEYKDGSLKVVRDIEVWDVEQLVEDIKSSDREALVLGEGVYKCIKELDLENIVIPSPDKNVSKAASVCALAIEKYNRGEDIHTCYDILPMYIRKSQAEIQYDEKQRKLGNK